MSDRLITIAKFEDQIQADLARQKLEEQGIEAVVTGQNASNIFSGLAAIEGPELKVFESISEKALKILELEKR